MRGGRGGRLFGETLLGSMNVASWEHDGFYKNSVTGQDIGGMDGEGVSGTLVWNISDGIAATFHTEYTDDTIEQAPYSAITPTVLKDIPLQCADRSGWCGASAAGHQSGANADRSGNQFAGWR